MPEPKRSGPSGRKPAAASPPTASEKTSAAAAIAAVRELLSRGVTITGDRLQETMDEAVRRGRMTRTDAEELIQVLIQIGRRQTRDVLAAAARRAPGTDRALRTVDRARRFTGFGSSFPVIGYDALTAAQVKERLADLSPAEPRKVRECERRNANRTSVSGAIEKRLG